MTATHASFAHFVAAAFAAAWAVTDWYLDQTTGLDTNDGLTAGTPLKTGAELSKRLGPWAQFGQSVTIHIGVNGIADDIVVNGQFLQPQTGLTITGTPTVVGSYVVASYTARVFTGTPNADQVTCTGVAAWTVGQRLVQTTGTGAGTMAFVVTDLGSGQAMTNPWARPNVAANLNWGGTLTPPQVGETVQVQTLPPVRAVNVNVLGVHNSTGSAAPGAYARRVFELSSVRVTNGVRYVANGPEMSNTWVFGADITGPLASTTPIVNGSSSIFSCLLRVDRVMNYQIINSGFVVPASGFATTNRINFGGFCNFSACVFYGMTCWCFPGGAINFTNCTVWQGEFAGIIVTYNTILYINNVAGRSTIAGSWGMQFQNVSMVRGVTTGWNLTGVAGEIQLSVAPTYALTPAQILPDDWSQKGVATLIGGVVDVVVPWFDPAVQRIAIGRNTPGGTTGDLSVPQANRTATGFRIQSTSASDTSTVDWQISPLGKGIVYAI
jgi:hypothetical protein